MSLKKFTDEDGTLHRLYVTKSNSKGVLKKRLNTRCISKAIARRFGCDLDSVYIDASTHTAYMCNRPIIEILDQTPHVSTKNVSIVWGTAAWHEGQSA
mmetsp:Transcript_5781/g.11812  ORF Transcript_5781/g.11812 Transcript_5781/m.11812 type:complete len:98 (+) Transcript_5781:1239-1532(+)